MSHIHVGYNILAKTTYHAINITSSKVELFAVVCEINQIVQVTETMHIIVITDIIYSAR